MDKRQIWALIIAGLFLALLSIPVIYLGSQKILKTLRTPEVASAGRTRPQPAQSHGQPVMAVAGGEHVVNVRLDESVYDTPGEPEAVVTIKEIAQITFVKERVPAVLFPVLYHRCVQDRNEEVCQGIRSVFEQIRDFPNLKDAFENNRDLVNTMLISEWESSETGGIPMGISEIMSLLKVKDPLELAAFFLWGSSKRGSQRGRNILSSMALGRNSDLFFASFKKPGEHLKYLLVRIVVKHACGKEVDALEEVFSDMLKSVENEKELLQFATELCLDPESLESARSIPRDADCVVCQENLRDAVRDGRHVVCPPCGVQEHALCQSCWIPWTRTRRHCPSCRQIDINHLNLPPMF